MTMTVDQKMRLARGGMGCAGSPPGHPTLFHHIESGSRANPNLSASLDYALENQYGDVPESIQKRVRALYELAKPVCSELWLRQTYGHFKNCYSPDGVERRADRLLIVGMGEPYYPGHPKVESGEVELNERYTSLNRGPVVQPDDPRCTPEHHAGYLAVKQYFPDHEPRLDLIAAKQPLGSRPCVKCEQTVQYEARLDTWAKVTPGVPEWRYEATCPQGGGHEVVITP